jgi:hypothetical protein
MLGTALALAHRGLYVFPIKPRSKEPACEHGCKDATTDANVIRRWWRFEPSYNVAIATGQASGIFVIDIDNLEAETRLTRLEAEHGKLPDTVEAITARGRHLYFRYQADKPVRNTTGRHHSAGRAAGERHA